MAAFLQLPKELRDEIWRYVIDERTEDGWSGYGPFGWNRPKPRFGFHQRSFQRRSILRTCHQILRELTPHFYAKVCVNVIHTNQTLRWLQTIGPRNSACIRHLVIRHCSLLLDFNEDQYLDDRRLAWVEAIRCMPSLLTLTYDFQQDHQLAPLRATTEHNVLDNDVFLLRELANSASAWSEVAQPIGSNSSEMGFHHYPVRPPPEGPSRESNQIFIAIDENLPKPLVRYFGNLLGLSHATSFYLPITGLPEEFFVQQCLNLSCTYTFNDKSNMASMLLSFRTKAARPISTDVPDLGLILNGPPPHYLRLSCRHMDSTSLMKFIPKAQEVITLDVAFSDANPRRSARFLEAVHQRCPKLYTIAIDISPLHDLEWADDQHEQTFKRETVSPKIAEEWQPFWSELDKISGNGVKVSEGEEIGFGRRSVSNEMTRYRNKILMNVYSKEAMNLFGAAWACKQRFNAYPRIRREQDANDFSDTVSARLPLSARDMPTAL